MTNDDAEYQAFLDRETRIVKAAMESIEALEEFKPYPVVGGDGDARIGWFWRFHRRPIPRSMADAQVRAECFELIRTKLRGRFWALPNLNDVRAGVIVHAALAIGAGKIIENVPLWERLQAEDYEAAHDILLSTDWPALAGNNELERNRILTFAREMRTGVRRPSP